MNPTTTQPWRVAAIGAGFTGLAAAHRIAELCRDAERPLSLTVFDAAPAVGGVTGTMRIGEYLVETGADSFITNKPWAVDLCRRIGLEDRLIPTEAAFRRSLVLRCGKPVEVPEGFMLLAPAKIWPVLKSPLFSWAGKLRMGLEYVLPRKKDSADESLASFVRRRFGNQALERLVQPLVGGIYTSDPEKLSLQATLPRFLEMERQHRSLIRASRKQKANGSPNESKASGARYGLFASLPGGISELSDALRRRVAEVGTIELGSTITGLRSTANGGWQVSRDDGTSAEFDAALVTVPAYRAAELLHETDACLAGQLREIDYASSAVVVTGHKLSDVRHPLDAFGLVIPAIEGRSVLAVSFASRKFPGRAPEGCVQLRTFVGGAMQPEELDRSDGELIEMVMAELRDMLGVAGEPDFAFVARHPMAMPQYHVGHLDRVAAIERRVAGLSALELAGNAYDGVGIPDCIHSGERAAERLFVGD